MNQLVKRAGLISLSTRLSARLTCASFAKRTLTSSGSDNDFRPSEELAKERYDSRANEDIERKRARLFYQSRKRGMLENGVIFSSFANKHLHKMNAVQLDQYDRLINLPTNDWDIFYWATKTKPTPPEYETQVMQMLRKHVNSKVSIENLAKPDAVLGKTRPDDIVLPPVGKIYELDIELDDVSSVDYKEQLFDPRIKRVGKGQMALMTNWRRKFFERRLRRKLPSLVSLGNLGTKYDGQVYTQKCGTRDALDVNIMSKHPIDTSFEKNMKHHETMQHILGRDITTDPLEYDDEVEAWADMFWHRNYGNHNHRIAPAAHIRCSKCSSNLHCSDPGLSGYIPQQLFIKLVQRGSDRKDDPTLLCQACNFDTAYQARIRHDLSPEAYERFLATIGVGAKAKTLLVVLCDLTDFPGSIWNNLINLVGGKCRLLVVGNKLDMLPYDGPGFIRRVLNSMRNNLSRLRPGEKDLYINDVIAISARTGFGVEGLVTRLLSYCEDPQDVYLIGNGNSGKSTLFSALMQTDLCAVRKGDLIARVARYKCKSTGVDMLRFPIDLCEAWQLETKRRKAERVERNTAERELALNRLSERRQESMPHMSMLVNRLSYETNSLTVTDTTTNSELVNPLSTFARFTPDHPLASIPESLPLSVDEGENYSQNGFFHHTPSAHHPDQLHQLLTQEEYLEVFHNETFIPRKYSLRPLSSIFISGLARLDLLTSQSNIIVTIFASKYLPVHVVPTKNADKFYHSFLGTAYLGVPRGNEQRLAAWPDLANLGGEFHIQGSELRTAAADVVFSSIGWASINIAQDQECIVKAYTPEGRGIFLRTPPLVARANSWSSGKKQRNTPVFDHQHYDTVHLRMGSSL